MVYPRAKSVVWGMLNARPDPVSTLTTEYLDDRAAFLVTQLESNTSGESIIGPQAVEYHDLGSRTMVTVTAAGGTTQRIVFGSDNNDRINHGGSEVDHLYGGKGSDCITIGVGDDYMNDWRGGNQPWVDIRYG